MNYTNTNSTNNIHNDSSTTSADSIDGPHSSLSNRSVTVSIAESIFTKFTGFSGVPAVLSWGLEENATISLTKESGETVFAVEPQRIKRFYVNFNVIDLVVDNQAYQLYSRGKTDDITYAGGLLTGAGGSYSVAKGTAEFTSAGIEDLKKHLANTGAKTNRNPLAFAIKFFVSAFLFVFLTVALITFWIVFIYEPK